MKRSNVGKWTIIFLLAIFVMPIGLVLCYGEKSILGVLDSFAINISASAITILFTMFFIDAQHGKIQTYQKWKKQLYNDKQDTVEHIFKVKSMIESIPQTKTDAGLERLKNDIALNLDSFPRRPSFNEHTTVESIQHDNTSKTLDVNTITINLNNISYKIITEIKQGTFPESPLIDYEGELFSCACDILTIVPRKFKDIKKDL